MIVQELMQHMKKKRNILNTAFIVGNAVFALRDVSITLYMYYNYIKNVQGSWCLPLLTSNPTPNPNPTPAECTRKSWVGDGYCDTQTNNAQCFYDSQDCCSPYKRSDWNRYCGNVSKMLISGSAEKVLNWSVSILNQESMRQTFDKTIYVTWFSEL